MGLYRTAVFSVSPMTSDSVIELPVASQNWPRGYKTFFMLNSAEHEICTANRSQITNNCKFLLAKHS